MHSDRTCQRTTEQNAAQQAAHDDANGGPSATRCSEVSCKGQNLLRNACRNTYESGGGHQHPRTGGDRDARQRQCKRGALNDDQPATLNAITQRNQQQQAESIAQLGRSRDQASQ